jgi:ubiquinone/menaquinone biosynthesis C-methylase UbiE
MNLNKIKKAVFNTPFNRNYIADLSLRKRMREASSYVSGWVLDVGCGEKPHEGLFSLRTKRYFGMDLPEAHLFYSADRCADVYGEGGHLPFQSKTFDTLICTEVLPHIAEPQKLFSEFNRVLKPNGAVIVTANKVWEKRTGVPVPDYWRFTDEGLAFLCEQQNLDVMAIQEGCGFMAMLGQMFSRFLYKEFVYYKSRYKGREKEPNIIMACIILPVSAVIQMIFLVLDKIYYSKHDTLFYIIVARKR